MPAKPSLFFVTAQGQASSTVIGRIQPLAAELQAHYNVQVLGLGTSTRPSFVSIGHEPFIRTAAGKKRLRGSQLAFNMLQTAWRCAWQLWQKKPDVVIIVKPLPSVIFGVWLWRWFNHRSHIILDVDDFELTANQLTSLIQRAAIHWSERTGARLAERITAATPFLVDHFMQLTQQTKTVELLPTGYTAPETAQTTTPTQAPPTILYIGSISISSGHRVDLLPEILQQVQQQVPNVQLIIAGTGDDQVALQQNFAHKQLASSVTWFGRFTANDVPSLLKQATIIIDPVDDSLANRAKSSFRVSLAAAWGWPIVTSNIGIRPYWLPDQLHSCFFATPTDVSDYVQKIVHLLHNPLTAAERHSMQERAKPYSWANLATTILKLLTF